MKTHQESITLDLGSDGVETQIADQVAAPSHSGTSLHLIQKITKQLIQ